MYPTLKRLADLLFASILLLLLSPVMLTVAILILIFEGRPVLFIQVRPGKNGALFKLVKFRTLETGDGLGRTRAVPNVIRPTRIGSFLRASSLDELPQLANILRGDMSFVGPRPLLTEYLHMYSPVQRTRHHVRPGLTGLAQVSGRNLLSWEDKLRLDVEYVKRISFMNDLRILAKTFKVVFSGFGISPGAHRATSLGTGDI